MLSQKKLTILIAGGGIAGLAAAVFLDELGFHITLVEKKPIFGGRTFSFQDQKTGFVVDNGQHLMIGAYHETIALLEKLGVKHKIEFKIPTQVPLKFAKGKKTLFTIKDVKAPFGILAAFLNCELFTLKEKLNFVRLGRVLKKIKKNESLMPKEATAYDWLLANYQTERVLKNFWEILTLATLNDSIFKASAENLIQVMLKSFFRKKEDGFLIFPCAGLSEVLIDPIVTYLKMRGHDLRTGIGVTEFKILNERVQTMVLTNGESRTADFYVSALPPQRLASVLPKPWLQSSKTLKPIQDFQFSPIVSVNLFFDQDFMTDVFIGSSFTATHWFFNKNLIFKNNNGLTHVMGVISGAYDFLDKGKDEIVNLALSDLKTLYPDFHKAKLQHALVNIERQATVSFDPVANASRPPQKILDNFFVIGDWTKTGLPATIESAVMSAKKMAQDFSELP